MKDQEYTAEHNGIKMKIIGGWQDLASYYSGSDGNAWSYSHCTRKWSNQGNEVDFRARFDRMYRGKLTA